MIISNIVECETEYSSWTLMHRYFRCRDLLKDQATSAEHLDYLFVWLRYSFMRQLTFQKGYNTKPKDLQHAQVCLIDEVTRRIHKDTESNLILSENDLLR